MRHHLLLAAAAAGVLITAGSAAADTLLASGSFAGTLYQVYGSGGIGWDAAEAVAVGLGGHLVSIHDDATNNYIYDNLVVPNAASLYFRDSAGNYQGPWIGAYRVSPGGSFAWIDGSPFDYAHWAGGEPNNFGGIEDAAQYFWNQTALGQPTWNDVPRSNYTLVRGYVVEVNTGGVPEPETWALMIGGFAGVGSVLRRRLRVPA